MKRIYWIVLASIFFLPIGALEAADLTLTPVLMLDHVKIIKATEHDGDELYFDIGEYQANQPTKYVRVPEKPTHWLSQAIEKNTSASLWTGSLKSGQAVTLIVSLIDSDMSVINPDDLIGSIRVQLKNDNGVLQARWSMPNTKEGPQVTASKNGDLHKFDLRNGGQYEVYLSLKY